MSMSLTTGLPLTSHGPTHGIPDTENRSTSTTELEVNNRTRSVASFKTNTGKRAIGSSTSAKNSNVSLSSRCERKCSRPSIRLWALQYHASNAQDDFMCPYRMRRNEDPSRFPDVVWTAELNVPQSETLCHQIVNAACLPVYSTMTVLYLTQTGGTFRTKARVETQKIITSFGCNLNDDRVWDTMIGPAMKALILPIYDLDKKHWASGIWNTFYIDTKTYLNTTEKQYQ